MDDENDIKIIVSDDEEEDVVDGNVDVEEEEVTECSYDDEDEEEEEVFDDEDHDEESVDSRKPLETVDQEQQQPISDLTLDVGVDDDVEDVDLEEGEALTDEETMVVSAAIEQHNDNNNNKRQCKWKRRRTRLRHFFSRRRGPGGGASYVRMGAVSWWTECKNIETSGCTFVLGYIVASFVLMSLMFNMREIVGDYCLGSKELKREEYRENLEKAMELRRRSSPQEENRFEKELAANLYYDKQGQISADDLEYFQNHRVPIIHYDSDSEDYYYQDGDGLEFDP